MKLQAKVTGLKSAHRHSGGMAQAEIMIASTATNYDQSFTVGNPEGYALDQELTLLVLTKQQASDLFDVLDGVDGERGLLPAPLLLRDQLRPDPLVPWEAGKVVNHKNSDPHDNQIANLEVRERQMREVVR